MQIAFLTLFLGLINGVQTVEIGAGPGVAAVEVLLDGHNVARLGGAPWRVNVDFGSTLVPHHLEARGLDAAGGEAVRAEQWVNLPRPPAEVAIAIEGAGSGKRARTARIAWERLSGEAPQEIRLTLDGAPLALDAQGRAPLELPRAGAAHVLSAALTFAGGVQARKDVVLTGDYDSDVATELTAVAVRTARPGRPLAVKDVQGLLLADGRPARVTVVDQESPEVFVVRAPGANPFLHARAMGLGTGPAAYAHFQADPRIRFHVVSPIARHSTHPGTASEIFDFSPPAKGRDLLRLLVAFGWDGLPGHPQLADAVAVAGLQALARQTPRAVVLLAGSGDGESDASLFLPAAVRGYLAAIGVPLFVWSTNFGKHSLHREDWGAIEDISTPLGIAAAYQRLESEVLAQQIVWIEGRHLPQSVRLAPTPAAGATPGGSAPAAGLTLVATPAPGV
jgi:hypothetical protein